MQNPNEDTEWNDVLRQKGILPPKNEKEFTEDDIINLVDKTVEEKKNESGKLLEDMTLDELDELEDEEDERVLLEYRKKRMNEMNLAAKLARYGEVREISAVDYVDEVNKAGAGIWVVLHLYKQGIPLCNLINQHIAQLSRKFPATKFLKSISTTCIPNYPDHNLPTIFVYFENNLKKQFIGPHAFGGMNLKVNELEWMLSEVGAVETDLEEDPRKRARDVLLSALREVTDHDDDNDW